jgi:hypothetical protein
LREVRGGRLEGETQETKGREKGRRWRWQQLRQYSR